MQGFDKTHIWILWYQSPSSSVTANVTKSESPINDHVDYDKERLYVISLTDKIAKAGRCTVR